MIVGVLPKIKNTTLHGKYLNKDLTLQSLFDDSSFFISKKVVLLG